AGSADHLGTDWRRALTDEALAGARLGVARNYFGWHPEIDRQMEEVLRLLVEAGATVVGPAEVPHLGEYDAAELEVLLFELKHDLNTHLAGLEDRGQPRTLAALIDFNRARAAEEMPWFGQELFERAEQKGPLTDPAYLAALEICRRLSRAEGLDAVLAQHRLDGLVCPTLGPAYRIDWVNGDHYGGAATSASAVSGYPHLTVPAGFVHGLPWGLSFLGPAWSEARLLGWGYAFERRAQARRPPT